MDAGGRRPFTSFYVELNMTNSRTKAALATPASAIHVDCGPIAMRAPAELIAYERNPRKHPEKQMTELMASMRRHGFNQPVLVTGSGEIIAGHARVEAARRLQLLAIPMICLDHLTPAQVREYRLADNQLGTLSQWDMELLSDELRAIIEIDEISCVETMGWDIPEVEILLDASPSVAQAKADPADEQLPLSADVVARPGDLWLLGKHRLLCGSSLEAENWVRLLNGEQALMSFVDPPYNVPVNGFVCGSGKVKHQEFQMASGEMSEAEFIEFLATFLERMTAHMVDGSITAAAMDFRHMYELQTAARRVGLSLLNMCVWNKSNGGMGSLYRSKHELIFIFKKGRARTSTMSCWACTEDIARTSGISPALTASARAGWRIWNLIPRSSPWHWLLSASATYRIQGRSSPTLSSARARHCWPPSGPGGAALGSRSSPNMSIWRSVVGRR